MASSSENNNKHMVEGLNFSDNKKKYLLEKLDPVLEEMVADTLKNMPSDPLVFMIDWLEKKSGPQVGSTFGQRSSILEDNAAMKTQLGRLSATLAEARALAGLEEEPSEAPKEETKPAEVEGKPAGAPKEEAKPAEGEDKPAEALKEEAKPAEGEDKSVEAPKDEAKPAEGEDKSAEAPKEEAKPAEGEDKSAEAPKEEAKPAEREDKPAEEK